MNWLRPEITIAVPFLIAVVLTAFLRRWAAPLGLIDRPDPARKVHTTPTPRAGGLAIFAAILLALPWHPFTFGWLPFPVLLTLAGILVVLGLGDDLRPIPWWIRLPIHVAVATAAVWDAPGLDALSRFVACFWLVAMVNAFNLLDNMDALSAGTAWIATLAFLLLSDDWAFSARLHLMTLGAIAGFLVHNSPPARIFMGDAGSTLLGFLVGMFGIELVVGSPMKPVQAAGAVLLICAVAVYDSVSVVLLRLSQGRSPFHGDKQHLSHRTADRGWSQPVAVAWIHLAALATGAGGVLLYICTPSVAAILAAVGILGWLSLAGYEFGFRRWRG